MIPTKRVNTASTAVTAIIAHTDQVRPRIDFTASLSVAMRSSRRGSAPPGPAGVVGVTRVRCTGAGAEAAACVAAEVCCGAEAGFEAVEAEGGDEAAGFDVVLAVGVRCTSAPSVGWPSRTVVGPLTSRNWMRAPLWNVPFLLDASCRTQWEPSYFTTAWRREMPGRATRTVADASAPITAVVPAGTVTSLPVAATLRSMNPHLHELAEGRNLAVSALLYQKSHAPATQSGNEARTVVPVSASELIEICPPADRKSVV